MVQVHSSSPKKVRRSVRRTFLLPFDGKVVFMNADIDVTGIHLVTKRLIPRPFEQGDVEDLYRYASVEGVGEMAGWPHHRSIGESQQILDQFIEEKKTLAVVFRQTQTVIGSIGIERYSPDSLTEALYPLFGREIGYVLSREYWGKGLMPEGVQAVISYCFDTLGYDFLCCGYEPSNVQSRRVCEKCGFTFLKETEYHLRHSGSRKCHMNVLLSPKRFGRDTYE